MNPVVRDRVLDICLDKPKLANALYHTVDMELDKIESGEWEEYDPDGPRVSSFESWEYEDVPIRAAHLGYLLDQDIIVKTFDSNSTSAFRFTDPETVHTAIEDFLEFQDMEEFEVDLYDVPDTGKEVSMTRSGNFYHIEWDGGSIEVPPNKVRELADGVKKAWRFEELRRRSEERQEE